MSPERVWTVQLDSELFWRLFEATGSIMFYILYKRTLTQ